MSAGRWYETAAGIGIMTLTVLFGAYLLEKWFPTTWPGLHHRFTFRQLVRDWLLYMLLSAGLGTVLERVLTFACAVSCEATRSQTEGQ